jgi:hypothetical protein
MLPAETRLNTKQKASSDLRESKRLEGQPHQLKSSKSQQSGHIGSTTCYGMKTFLGAKICLFSSSKRLMKWNTASSYMGRVMFFFLTSGRTNRFGKNLCKDL